MIPAQNRFPCWLDNLFPHQYGMILWIQKYRESTRTPFCHQRLPNSRLRITDRLVIIWEQGLPSPQHQHQVLQLLCQARGLGFHLRRCLIQWYRGHFIDKDTDKNCIKLVDCFGYYGHFNNINSTSLRTWDIFPFLWIIVSFLYQCPIVLSI